MPIRNLFGNSKLRAQPALDHWFIARCLLVEIVSGAPECFACCCCCCSNPIDINIIVIICRSNKSLQKYFSSFEAALAGMQVLNQQIKEAPTKNVYRCDAFLAPTLVSPSVSPFIGDTFGFPFCQHL